MHRGLEPTNVSGGRFELISPFKPQGDQPAAIAELVAGLKDDAPEQVLLGVTGSGKTYTVAKVIEAVNRPTLVLSHNKTLAAQLYQEFRSFFPNNAVEYFVSYYDYYQPEAYVPQSDIYIEKETSINEEIDRLRLRATISLFERRDVLVVASVSCIYGLGAPDVFFSMLQFFERGTELPLERAQRSLAEMQYERTRLDLFHGSFRVRGDVLEILPAYDDRGIRVEYFGDEIDRICRFDVITGRVLEEVDQVPVFPRNHYVTPEERMRRAIASIEEELGEHLVVLERENRLPRDAAIGAADPLRPGDAARARFVRRHRELLAPPVRPGAGGSPADVPGLPARGLPAGGRREPPVDSAGSWDVPRRPGAQGDPGRVRLPPAERPGTTGRSGSTSSRSVAVSASTCRPRRVPSSWSGPAAWWWSR